MGGRRGPGARWQPGGSPPRGLPCPRLAHRPPLPTLTTQAAPTLRPRPLCPLPHPLHTHTITTTTTTPHTHLPTNVLHDLVLPLPRHIVACTTTHHSAARRSAAPITPQPRPVACRHAHRAAGWAAPAPRPPPIPPKPPARYWLQLQLATEGLPARLPQLTPAAASHQQQPPAAATSSPPARAPRPRR